MNFFHAYFKNIQSHRMTGLIDPNAALRLRKNRYLGFAKGVLMFQDLSQTEVRVMPKSV